MSILNVFEFAGSVIFSAFDVFTRPKQQNASRAKKRQSASTRRQQERDANKVGFFSWLFGGIITKGPTRKVVSRSKHRKKVVIRRRKAVKRVAVNPFAALAAEAEMEAAEKLDAEAQEQDVDETAVLAMQEQLAAMQRQIEDMRRAAEEAVPVAPTPPTRDDVGLWAHDSPAPPLPPRSPAQPAMARAKGVASPMLVRSRAVVLEDEKPDSMSVSDMIKQNLALSLRKTNLQRSPGGTPFREHDENSPAGKRTLVGALKAKFSKARGPPSPSRIAVSDFSDEEDDDWMTPPSTPIRY